MARLVSQFVMRFRLVLSLVVVVTAPLARGATVPQYVNSAIVQSPPQPAPQIDAVTFINEGYFEVNDFSFNPLPYESANTLTFKNMPGGIMYGSPGYFFEHVSGNTRGPLSTFENRGSISAFNNISNSFISFSSANWLLVDSDSIVSSGNLSATAQGLIRLTGNTVNVARGRIRLADPLQTSAFYGGSYMFRTNYYNETGISDLYWGVGTNDVDLTLSGQFAAPSFSTTNIRSAVHTVVDRTFGFPFTNTFNIIPDTFLSKGGISSTHITSVGTNLWVQTVFVVTNFFDTNLTTDIKFVPQFGSGPTIVQVGFQTSDRDITLDQDVTNSLYVIDGLATRTNATLARNNLVGGFFRPDTFSVSKGPYSFGGIPVPGNSTSNGLPPFLPTYGTNFVQPVYAAYSAQLQTQSFTGSDPTNFPGRFELVGQNVNMRDSRIRAESTVSITADNLLTNNMGRISAPFVNFDIGTTQPQLLISNLAPPTVSRLYGTVSAWSTVWENSDSRFPTTNFHFHVLVIDHTLQTAVPVTVSKFLVKAPRLMLYDDLSVNQRLRVEAGSMHVKTNGGLNFPANWAWGASNMVNLSSVTNEGFLNVPGPAVLGTDKNYVYTNLVNKGTFTVQSFSILGDYFENWGSIVAQAGNFRFDGRKACLFGEPLARQEILSGFIVGGNPPTTNFVTNIVYTGASSITARGDLTISASSVSLSNCVLRAGTSVPGAVIITPGIRLTDAGPGHTNYWLTTGGIRVTQRPTSVSDLMGTYATVAAPAGSDVQSVWTSADVGAIAAGYSNNLALGKLTLDGGEDSVIRIAGLIDKKKAMYVDYLELLNNATNFDKPDPSLLGLVIDSTMVLYFAHANFDAAKLDGKQNGRIRWVKGFMGPLSTTNIVYPSGVVYPVNISLARHKDFDSDGDGIPNIKDPTPVFSPESINLIIGKDAQPNRVLLSWQALANSTSYVEYKSPIASSGAWQVLRSTSAPVNMRMSMTDTSSGVGRTQRIYRVRVDLPPQ